jgi:hypothetical protein
MDYADELRDAAEIMRERAQAATQGPWVAWVMGSEGYLVLREGGTVRDRGRNRVARVGLKDWDSDKADAEHIAGMHPGVALALADWLELRARQDGGFASQEAALAVARAYLGTSNDEEG